MTGLGVVNVQRLVQREAEARKNNLRRMAEENKKMILEKEKTVVRIP